MPYLVDTCILVRRTDAADPSHLIAVDALSRLHQQRESLCVAPQNCIEFRTVATRPVEANGLGMSAGDADLQINAIERLFSLLPENAAIYPTWKVIISAVGTIGKQVYDARLVAICQVYGISHILTFNTDHFRPFASIGPGLTAVHPRDVR